MRCERSYGGKAGIWLKKRRTHVSKALGFAEAEKRQVQIQPFVRGSDDSSNSSSSSCLETENKEIVGWDDVLCRPIYNVVKGNMAFSENAELEPVDTIIIDKGETNQGLRFEGRKTRRKYGGSRRHSNMQLLSERQASEYERKHGSSNMEDSTNRVSTSRCESDSGSILNEPVVISIPIPAGALSGCSALDSNSKDVAIRGGDTDAEQIRDSCVSNDEKRKEVNQTSQSPGAARNKPNLLPSRNRRKRVSRRHNASQESNETFEFVEEAVFQPSSKTSVEVAKAFFERLDSTEKLVIDGSRTPQLPGTRCVRTSHMVNISSPKLMAEYSSYAAASKESGIDPLSIKEYALNRGTFFRASEIYDGFLDG